MRNSIRPARQLGHLRKLSRRRRRQAMLSWTGFDGDAQPRTAREQQALALVGAEQQLSLVRRQLKRVGNMRIPGMVIGGSTRS